MKNIMTFSLFTSKLILVASATLILSSVAHAGKKLVIMTNQPNATKAKEIKKHILSVRPFSLMEASEFRIEVKQLNARDDDKFDCKPRTFRYSEADIKSFQAWAEYNKTKLSKQDIEKYRQGFTSDRLVECDKAEMAAVGAQMQADFLMYVHNSDKEGGSGGDIPVILSGSIPGIGLHEWLHAFDFADEYAYESAEAPIYCASHEWTNLAIFKPKSSYRSSSDVRTLHGSQIPWLDTLTADAKLVSGEKFGTPNSEKVGIFPSITCSKMNPKLDSWKPSKEPTIMQDTYSTYLPHPYWKTIFSHLGISSARSKQLLTVPSNLGYTSWGTTIDRPVSATERPYLSR